MRFVPVKSEEQQAVMMVHRARSLVIENRTAQVNQIRGLLAEFGLVVAQGIEKLRGQLPDILEDAENGLPALVRETLAELLEQWRDLDERIAHYDRQIAQLAAASEPAQRLMGMEGLLKATVCDWVGIGPLTATAVVASAGDARVFASGRQFAAWLGMVPRQHSSGGKFRLGAITKRGDAYLRRLLICPEPAAYSPALGDAETRRASGRKMFRNAGVRMWRRSPWSPNMPGSSGRCSPKAKRIGRPEQRNIGGLSSE